MVNVLFAILAIALPMHLTKGPLGFNELFIQPPYFYFLAIAVSYKAYPLCAVSQLKFGTWLSPGNLGETRKARRLFCLMIEMIEFCEC